jgi:hypothetical protein
MYGKDKGCPPRMGEDVRRRAHSTKREVRLQVLRLKVF